MAEGDRTSFFSLWDKTFNETLRSSDPVYQKIEFSMSLYFSVFPINEHVSPEAAKNYSLQYSMDEFKQFLETRGASLCKSQSHLAYFALPYVPDPKTHATFQELFTESWIQDLKDRLVKFLATALTSQSGPPRILQMLRGLVTSSFSFGNSISKKNKLTKNQSRTYIILKSIKSKFKKSVSLNAKFRP
jgi:hypothetical protein